jgi:hypothetical protein
MKVDVSRLIQALFPTYDVNDPEDIKRIVAAIDANPEKVNEAMRAIVAAAKRGHAPDEELDALL